MKLPFKGSLYKDVAAIFDVIRIYPAVISNGGASTYWFFLYLPLILVFVYTFLTLLLDHALQKSKGKYIKLYLTIKLMHILSIALCWILLIPGTDFSISIFECHPVTGRLKYDNNLVCWEGTHCFFCVLFSISLILQIGITVVVALLYNESRSSHTDALTRLDANQEVYLVVYRVLLVVVSHYTSNYSTF